MTMIEARRRGVKDAMVSVTRPKSAVQVRMMLNKVALIASGLESLVVIDHDEKRRVLAFIKPTKKTKPYAFKLISDGRTTSASAIYIGSKRVVFLPTGRYMAKCSRGRVEIAYD